MSAKIDSNLHTQPSLTEIPTQPDKTITQSFEEFAYVISHDLKAPIRHINGFTKILKEELESNGYSSRAHEFLDRSIIAQNLLTDYLNAILRFSRIGRAELNFEIINLKELIQERIKAIESEVTVQFFAELDDIIVFSDEKMILDLLQEFLDNAIQFSKPGNVPKVKISLKEDESNVYFLIEDEGIGFQMQNVDQLFRLFHSLHSESECKTKGIGAGLYLAMNIASRLGASIVPKSAVGKGSQFEVIIPKRISLETIPSGI